MDKAFYYSEQYQNNTEFRLMERARARLKKALRLYPRYKIKGSTFTKIIDYKKSDLLIWSKKMAEQSGCSIDDLFIQNIKSLPECGEPRSTTLTKYMSLDNWQGISPMQAKVRLRLGKRFRVRQRDKANQDIIIGLKDAGFTTAQLEQRVESTFTQGMSWQAFLDGDIHIDHIKPLCMFEVSDIEEIKRAYALDNVQALWAEDNMAKGNTYPTPH